MIWRAQCPGVATIHDLAPFHVPGKYDRARMFYARHVARWLATRQKQILTISQTTADDIRRFLGVSAERINVIFNGIDHERFHPGDAEEARRFVTEHYGLRKPYFIYVSRLEHPSKNHVRLIEAFNAFRSQIESGRDAALRCPRWQLVFAGGDWHGADVIHQAARRSPFASEIRSLGFVPAEDLPLLYRAAGACVYPSLFEGFGLPPIEAMACGCPVISSNRGSLGEVVEDAGMQLDPEDIAAWKMALGRISCDALLHAQLRSPGLIHARQFDWRQTAAATISVYKRALGVERVTQTTTPIQTDTFETAVVLPK